jgi:hypothetical protein
MKLLSPPGQSSPQPAPVIEEYTNQGEPKNFIKTALSLKGSVTPRVLPRVGVAALYFTRGLLRGEALSAVLDSHHAV